MDGKITPTLLGVVDEDQQTAEIQLLEGRLENAGMQLAQIDAQIKTCEDAKAEITRQRDIVARLLSRLRAQADGRHPNA